MPLKCDLFELISFHFGCGRGKLVSVEVKVLLSKFREQYVNTTMNTSRVREPPRALISDTLSLVLPLNWQVYSVGSSASAGSSAQLQQHPGGFCWPGFVLLAGVVQDIGRRMHTAQWGARGIYPAKSEFCTNRMFCLVLDGVWVSEVPECCSSAWNASISVVRRCPAPWKLLSKEAALGNGSVKPPALVCSHWHAEYPYSGCGRLMSAAFEQLLHLCYSMIKGLWITRQTAVQVQTPLSGLESPPGVELVYVILLLWICSCLQ